MSPPTLQIIDDQVPASVLHPDTLQDTTLPLPGTVRKNGFTYIKVLRVGRKCIYEQMYCEDLHYFEVFIVQQSRERMLNGKALPPKELFPSNEDFGKTAWAYRTLTEALTKFKTLNNQLHESNDIN